MNPHARWDDKRDANEAAIVDALRQAGASVQRLTVIDLLVGYRGRTWLLEVKVPGKSWSQQQIDWCDDWRGAPVILVTSVEEALRAIGAGAL